jgi:PAS domain S-box-containing protein
MMLHDQTRRPIPLAALLPSHDAQGQKSRAVVTPVLSPHHAQNQERRTIGTSLFRIVSVLAICCAPLSLWSRAVPNAIGPYVHNSWNSEDGLPQNSVQAIVQTKDGYLWLGTQEGLVRFNGVQFTVFNKSTQPEFILNDVRALLEDHDGSLWIGTFGGGVLQYRNGKFRTYLREDGLSNNSGLALLEDSKGTLWVGTDSGLNRFEHGKFVSFDKEHVLSDAKINALAEDHNGDLWVATNKGLNRVSLSRGENSAIEHYLSDYVIKSLYVDSKGDLWVGTQRAGLYRFTLPKNVTSNDLTQAHYGTENGLPNVAILAILHDANVLWVGTGGGGLCSLATDKPGSKFECYTSKDGWSGNSVESLLRDREGSLWAGSETGGLNRLKLGVLTVFAAGEAPDDAARSIFEGKDGSLWVAMDSGLRRYKDGQIKFYHSSNTLPNSGAWSVIEDRDGNIWLGTKGGGLNEFTKNGTRAYTIRDGLADDAIYAVFQDHTGDIWVGTPYGISRFHHGKFTTYTKKDGISGRRVWLVFEDHAQNLWFGTDTGLALFKNGVFSNFDFDQPGSGTGLGGVTYLYEDHDNVLWIGTGGNGLKRLSDGNFTTYRRQDGMFDDTVWAILEDDLGNFWMSSNRGIFRVKKSELNDFADHKIQKITSVSYGTADGMPESECNGASQMPALKTRAGKLLFACVRAVVAVNPQNLSHNPLPPPVVIESASANQQPLSAGDRVPVGKGELDFHFAALSYLAPEKVKIRYMLDKQDHQWRDAADGQYDVPYTNIPPGEYVFRVIAANNDGVWNEQGASLRFYLKPRFYQTIWFYMGCAVCVFWLGGAGYLLRIRQVRKREAELVVLVNERTGELQQEVAQRQEVEEELRRTASIVESSYDAIWSIDRKGSIVTWNTGAEKLFGYSAKEAIGQNALLIFPPERSWELDHYMPQLLEGECVTNLETVRQNKNGESLDLSLSLSPIFKDGNVIGVSLIARDITRRKKAEEALQQAKDAAEAATRAKSEFLANMSHEIRTPLNGMIGMVELARHTRLTPEQGELLTMANDSANTLLVLINDILDFSKIEAGKLEFDTAEFDLAEIVSDTLRSMALRAHEKGLELACYISPDLPQYFIGDALRLKQVLTNLLGNAIKFTQHGEVVLRVEPGKAINDGQELMFSISDTGIGIPAEKRRSIFEAFSQADASTTRRFGGSGLGLAISSRIVALMGGNMWVESEPGQGSTFYFTARLKLAKDAKVESAAAPAEFAGVPILIVDESLTTRRILAQILASWGMRAVTAENGAAALEKLRAAAHGGDPFTLALIANKMAGMDGFALVEQTSRDAAISTIPIMMLTSDQYHSTALRCRQAGITAHLLKPVKKSELLATLETVLQSGTLTKASGQAGLHQAAKSPAFKILVVEDNLVNQKVAVRILEKAGHQVAVANTGKKALEILGEEAFDLILMDLQMPEMDGFAATAAIREGEKTSGHHVPIIAMTAHAMKGDRERCLENGMDEYIAKPINAGALLELITRVMAHAEILEVKPRGQFQAIQ